MSDQTAEGVDQRGGVPAGWTPEQQKRALACLTATYCRMEVGPTVAMITNFLRDVAPDRLPMRAVWFNDGSDAAPKAPTTPDLAVKELVEAGPPDMPSDVVEALLAIGEVEWGHTGEKTDAEHVAEFADTVRLTREHFNYEEPTDMHGVYLKGTGVVVCHTGMSPNSGQHARIIVGAWNHLVGEARALAALGGDQGSVASTSKDAPRG